MTTPSGAGSGSGTSATRNTSGPPGFSMTTARIRATVSSLGSQTRPACSRRPPAARSTVATMERIAVGVGPLTETEVVAVARHGAGVELAADALDAVAASRSIVEGLAGDVEPHYGISTGFGALATKHIPTEQRAQLQRSLIRSHAAGSGPEVEREVVRGLMLLRLSTLATGRTGVRAEVAELMAALLNAGITPVVHECGSLGCSGDLAPLSHCALALIGEGDVRDGDGVRRPA